MGRRRDFFRPNIASPSLAVSPNGRTILYARIEGSNSDLMLAKLVS